MRTKLYATVVTGMFCFGLMLGTEAAADDSVYVDLSVLDSLGATPVSVAAPSAGGPLFPIVKKAEKKKAPAVKKKKAKKAKVKPVVVKTEVKVLNETPAQEPDKIVLPEKAVDAPLNEKPSDIATLPETSESKAETYADSPFGVSTEENIPEVTSAAPVTPVLEEEQPVAENATPPVSEPMNAFREIPTEKNDDPTFSSLPESAETKPVESESLFSEAEPNKEAAEPAPQPLIPATIAADNEVQASAPSAQYIVFEETSDELDENSKQILDGIVAGFENPAVNKISIMAYNFDDGEDVFRKKRLNLNRAIAVRSYLLGKGYKNFSLKVITIADDTSKKNKVMLEELK